MKKDITIVAEPRAERGKNEARRLRAGGRIPAVVYGAGKDATAVSVDPKEIDKILYSSTGHNTIFNVEVDGLDTSPAMIVDWQHDPVKDNLLHIDLERIDLTRKLTAKVPVHLEGEAVGVKTQGGLMEVITREIEIECLPGDIPEHFTVDVSELMIGDNLRASVVSIGEGIELKSNPNTVLCHVVELRAAEEEAEEEAEGEAAEGEGDAEATGEEKPSEEKKES
ncbi:MAG: 50S ribosomal protein L25 [bacterium]|nr:50S ribosomal protein L25 [bacterium]